MVLSYYMISLFFELWLFKLSLLMSFHFRLTCFQILTELKLAQEQLVVLTL